MFHFGCNTVYSIEKAQISTMSAAIGCLVHAWTFLEMHVWGILQGVQTRFVFFKIVTVAAVVIRIGVRYKGL